MFYVAFGLDAELAIIAISTMDNPHPFDLLRGECCNLLFGIPDKPQATDATAIREGDVFAFQFPTALLVLNTPVIVLKFGIAFLAWFLLLAVVIEARNSKPGTVSTGLPCLRIEVVGKRVCFGKGSTGALQIILGETTTIHPQAQTLVADELYDANGFIDSSVLLRRTIDFVLIDQHPALLAFLLSLDMLF